MVEADLATALPAVKEAAAEEDRGVAILFLTVGMATREFPRAPSLREAATWELPR